MPIRPDWQTGTISLAANGTALVGTNTGWLSANIQAGDSLKLRNLDAVIASVNSDTSITLAEPWTGGAVAAGSAYRIRYQSDGSRLTAAVRDLVDVLKNGKLDVLAGLTWANGKLFRTTGANTAEMVDATSIGLQDSANGKLAAFRDLTWAANKLAYFTGAAAAAVTDLTAFARTLLASADAASARSALGAQPVSLETGTDSTTDFNALTTPGWQTSIYSSSSPNTPDSAVSGWFHILNVLYLSAQNVLQMAFPYRANQKGLFYRICAAGTWAARWTLLFDQSNAVGTVSQSGGVPTGAIVERGSNANGEYTRFADGTQICAMNISVTDQAIDNSYSSLFQATRLWTFPAAFASPPAVQCSGFRWGSSAGWGTIGGTPSATSVSLRGLDTGARAAGTAVIIQAMAFGRWF